MIAVLNSTKFYLWQVYNWPILKNGVKIMKRIPLIITFMFLFLISTNAVFAEEIIKPQTNQATYNVAIVPYINSTEETKDYIKDIINNKYTEQYANKNFQTVPLVDVQKALNKAGYDSTSMELPDKDVLSAIAKETKADYVIAMEVSQLITTRHMSFFSTKVETKAKLKYKFFNASQDKMVMFQTTGKYENVATLIGNVGYKEPITKALNQAMDEANEKIMGSL